MNVRPAEDESRESAEEGSRCGGNHQWLMDLVEMTPTVEPQILLILRMTKASSRAPAIIQSDIQRNATSDFTA